MTWVAVPRLHALLAMTCLSLACLDGGASAQEPGSDRGASGTRTVIGTPNAAACSRAVTEGVSTDEALEHCDRALLRERLNREAETVTHINRGALHLRRMEAAAALADFDAAIELSPNNAEAHFHRGAALIQSQEPGLAVAALTRALSLGISQPHKAYFNRGVARENLGDIRGAYEDYNTALEIQPDWGPANAELARFARGRRERLAGILAGGAAGAAASGQ